MDPIFTHSNICAGWDASLHLWAWHITPRYLHAFNRLYIFSFTEACKALILYYRCCKFQLSLLLVWKNPIFFYAISIFSTSLNKIIIDYKVDPGNLAIYYDRILLVCTVVLIIYHFTLFKFWTFWRRGWGEIFHILFPNWNILLLPVCSADQLIKTNQQNILIRSLTLKKQKGDPSSKDAKGATAADKKRYWLHFSWMFYIGHKSAYICIE